MAGAIVQNDENVVTPRSGKKREERLETFWRRRLVFFHTGGPFECLLCFAAACLRDTRDAWETCRNSHLRVWMHSGN